MDDHFERECDLRSILDRIKDYEHSLLERRHRSLAGQVNHLKELIENPETNSNEFSADQVVDACLVELNLLESPPEDSAWYLDLVQRTMFQVALPPFLRCVPPAEFKLDLLGATVTQSLESEMSTTRCYPVQ